MYEILSMLFVSLCCSCLILLFFLFLSLADEIKLLIISAEKVIIFIWCSASVCLFLRLSLSNLQTSSLTYLWTRTMPLNFGN